MSYITRISAFFCACLLSFQAWGAASTFEFDWEVASPSAANVRNATDGYWYHGNCFAKSAGDLFNSVELSTKYKRLGSKSIRLERWSLLSNSQGHNNCESFLKSDTERHRNEIRYGYGKGVGTFENWVMGAERWLRFSVYLPSDEGNFNTWNTSTKRIMLAQLIGTAGTDHTPEVEIILTGGPKLHISGYYGTAASGGTEVGQTFGSFNLKKDAWNDIIVRHRRNWQDATESPSGHGILQIWANCTDWAACTPVVDFSGRAAIRNKTTGWFKHGPYANISTTWDHRHVVYSDAIKVAIRDTETDAQMLALMAADFSGVVTPPTDPETPIASDLNVNAGAEITSSQDPINFMVTGMNDITRCRVNASTDDLPVKWDYTGTAGGKFVGPDTTGFSAAGTVKCYDTSYIGNVDVSVTDHANPSSLTTDSTQTSLDHWGYTAGRRIVKAASDLGNAYFTYGGTDTAYRVATNDDTGFDLTYSCTGTSCQNMIFDFYYPTVGAVAAKRIRASGTAGALVWENTADPEMGTEIAVNNYTLPDDTYRVLVSWKATEASPQNFRVYSGWGSASAASLTLDVVEVVMRKNPVTRVIEDAVTFDVPDVTAPVLSNCTITNTLSGVIETDGTPGYKAAIACEADEIGGTDYAMITTTDPDPDPVAADIQAGTGSIWSSSKSADTVDLAFEANGMSYQDLYAWVIRCDTVPNCSAVQKLVFDTPAGTKKIKFTGDTALTCRSAGAGAPTNFDDEIYIIIGSGNPRPAPGDPFPTILAYDSDALIDEGEYDITDATLEYGSINSLDTGDQGYYMWGANADGSCRWSAPVQVVAE
jgi:hypothetical protein